MKPRRGYNPKRKIEVAEALTEANRNSLALRIAYGGNPEHKRTPGNYGLSPPRNPRPMKTLCDADRQFPKAEAEALLRAGARKGLVSQQRRNEWPQNIWAVSEGVPFEAQLENSEKGVYHGYPMPADDDFKDIIVKEWSAR